MKNWLIVLIIFIVPIGLYAFLSSQDASAEKTTTTFKCPHTTLYKFYSPLCSDCEKQTKEMKGLQKEFQDRVEFSEINVASPSSESNGTRNLVKKYNVQVVPTIIIADCKGNMIKKYDSVATHNELQKALEAAVMSEEK